MQIIEVFVLYIRNIKNSFKAAGETVMVKVTMHFLYHK